jgi:hypothetical protein
MLLPRVDNEEVGQAFVRVKSRLDRTDRFTERPSGAIAEQEDDRLAAKSGKRHVALAADVAEREIGRAIAVLQRLFLLDAGARKEFPRLGKKQPRYKSFGSQDHDEQPQPPSFRHAAISFPELSTVTVPVGRHDPPPNH